MALGPIDELLKKLNPTEGKGLPFSLLGTGGQQQGTLPTEPVGTGTVLAPKSPDLFSSVTGGINKIRESGVKLGQDLAAGIKEGVGSIFGQGTEDRDVKEKVIPKQTRKTSPAQISLESGITKPPLAAPPLQGGSTQLTQPETAPTGVSRIQQILDQQLELRNQIRSRRQ